MVLFYNNFTLHRKVENHTNLRKKNKVQQQQNNKKTKPEGKKMRFPVAPWLELCFLYTK